MGIWTEKAAKIEVAPHKSRTNGHQAWRVCNRTSQTCSDNKGPFLTILATQTKKTGLRCPGVKRGRGARRQAGCLLWAAACNFCTCPDSATADD